MAIIRLRESKRTTNSSGGIMKTRTVVIGLLAVISIGAVAGCNEIEKNPRTWGTIGGAAAGAAAGAAIDRDQPARGAIIGGAAGGAAGNVGGEIYKQNRD
jgi:hypothetical protein